MNDLKSLIPPPPKRAGNRAHQLEDLPKADLKVKDNLSIPNEGFADLNFKVSPSFHRKFKTTSAHWGMSMKELLEASFKAWQEKIGNEPPPDLFEK